MHLKIIKNMKKNIYKKLLGIVVLGLLFISVPSKADDIRDFEIEGMSLEDNLSVGLLSNEIQKWIDDGYK